jgi:SanA protein
MKSSLVNLGVPKERIYCDYAGFRTLDSVVRARAVFGQRQITIISQDFHNQRAIFIARHRGIDAIGFDAQGVSAYYSFGTHCREQASKVNAILEIFVFHSRPRFYGPRVLVGIEPPVDSLTQLIGYLC